jgi:hypothetical protein
MTHKKWLLHKLLTIRFLTTCTLIMTIFFTQAVQAEYQPPRNQRPPRTMTDTSGTRLWEQGALLVI